MLEENPETVTEHQKECTICHELFPIHQFRKHRGLPFDASSGCKKCLNEAGRSRYLSRKEDPFADTRFALQPGFSGPVPEKMCSICEIFMELDKFPKHHSSRFNRDSKCVTCKAEEQKLVRKVKGSVYNKHTYDRQTPEKRIEMNGVRQRYRKGKRASDPRVRMIQNAQNRCRITGREFSIKRDDIQIPELCPVFGTPFTNESTGTSVPYDNSYSLDRIANDRGYVPGNVKVISYRANAIKSDATLAELEAIVAYMKANLPQERSAAAA